MLHRSLPTCLFTIAFAASSLAADKPAIDFSGFNKDLRPQDDFFEHVNGQWIKDTPIPADKTRWGSFVILAEESRDAVQGIIDELSGNAHLSPGSDGQKIRDLYRSYLDEARANQLGLTPIAKDLAAIESSNAGDFAKEWATAGRLGVKRPISF